MDLKNFALNILRRTIQKIQPDFLLKQKLEELNFYKTVEASSNLFVISLGKAGFTMGISFYDYLKQHHLNNKILKGFICTPYHTKKFDFDGFEIIESSHPYPDKNSLLAGERLFEITQTIPKETTIIVLLSGGASSLIEKPIDTISLEEIQHLTEKLLKSGATIQEINTIRKKLSLIKGGGLAEMLYPRDVYQFLLSDVIGPNAEEYVSSGPMYPDKTSDEKVYQLLEQYSIEWSKKILFPQKNRTSLKSSYTIGNNEIAAQKLKESLIEEGYRAEILRINFTGNLVQYEQTISNDIKNFLEKPKNKHALIWGGEPTIRITGTGIGGRNQELCLRIAFCLKEFSQYKNKILFSSFGTDGIDGPTDSAGGIVFCDSVQKINDLIKNHQEYSSAEDLLRNNDSYTALNLIDGLIKIGPTGTNLNDLSFFVYD